MYSVLLSYLIFSKTSKPYITFPTGEYSPVNNGASLSKIKNWVSSEFLLYDLAKATDPLSNLNLLLVSDIIVPYFDLP